MTRAVLYARVSADDTRADGRNLAGQLEMCRKYAAEHGYEVVAELAEDDRGASGAAFELPQLNRVREMTRAKQFDVLVAREIDRLSRSLVKQLIVEEELRRAGVAIEYTLASYEDTPEGRLNKHIKATIAEYEREKIGERTVRGRRMHVENGSTIVHGHAPYGYRAVRGEHGWRLEVDAAQAQVVSDIFNLAATGGRGLSFITAELDKAGVETPAEASPELNLHQRAGSGWAPATVYGILTNKTYIGEWTYGKINRRTNKPGVLITVAVPPIIEQELWDAARAALAFRRTSVRHEPKYEYLLASRLTCGVCGYAVSCHRGGNDPKYLYYLCNRRKVAPGGCTITRQYRAAVVDEVVWQWVTAYLLDPAKLAEGLAEQQAARENEDAPLRQRLSVVDGLLAEHRVKLDRLVDLYLAGDFVKEALLERKTRLETTIAGLDGERTRLTAQLAERVLTAQQVQDLGAFMADAASGLSALEDFASRRRLIELLKVRGTLTVEDGVQVCYASCLLSKARLSLLSGNSYTDRQQERAQFTLSARLVLPNNHH